MKNIYRYSAFWGLFVIFVLAPLSSEAAFLVEFHNGRKVSVEGYQMEGKSCELYLESGSFRVPREEIKSIREKKEVVARLPKEPTPKDEPTTAIRPEEEKAPKHPETTGTSREKKLAKDSVPQSAEIESIIQKKAELRERLEEAKSAYFTATEKTEKDWARKKMISCSRDLFTLEAEVKAKHNGTLPEWWKEN